MRNRTALLALALPAVLLTACGTGSDVQGSESVSSNGDQVTYLVELTYNGHPLHCVRYGHGMSCDWVRYHQENQK